MKVICDIPILLPPPSVATIGFFDGVHQGHRYLIDQVKEIAAKKHCVSAVVTFPVHPRKVMNAYYKPELLTVHDEKVKHLETTGLDQCFLLDFTSELSKLTAFEFMGTVLRDKYNVQCLVIGYDHKFGYNRSETFEDYCRFGQQLGIEVVQARACSVDHKAVSSSVIRRFLRDGEVEKAAHFLGYPYYLDGFVVGGYKIGRTIGYPTANLRVEDPEKLIPAVGVYAVRVEVEGKTYGGMLNIGYRPTFNDGPSKQSIEVHILHFDADIYDAPVRLSFVSRIRSEMKFSDKDALIRQLAKDAVEAEQALR